MNKTNLFLLPLLAALILTGVASGQPRMALVIGNAAYQTKPLRNPENDAKDVAAALGKLRFEVILRVNADYSQMQEAIYDFAVRLGRHKGVGLFYFAGHGVQIDGENYLLPLGIRVTGPQHLKSRAINLAMLLSAMMDAKNHVNIIILDACRNNPFSPGRSIGRDLSLSRGLAAMEASAGVLIVYATSPGTVAADGSGRNGVFTKCLLSYINSNAHIEDMLRRVRKAVYRETGGKQLPWSSSSLMDKFYFNPGVDQNNNNKKRPSDQKDRHEPDPDSKQLAASDKQRQLSLPLPPIFQRQSVGRANSTRLALPQKISAVNGKNWQKLPLLAKLSLLSQAFTESEQACLARQPSSSTLTNKSLPNLSRIKELDLSWFPLAKDALSHLSQFTALERLDLCGCSLDDSDLVYLRPLTALQILDISHSKIGDAGLANLANFGELRELISSGCDGIQGQGLSHLSTLALLKRLDLDNCERLDDEALKNLAKFPALKILSLCYCQKITDSGLAALGQLSSLQTLYLIGCRQISKEAIARLQQALPALTIHRQ